MQSEFSKVIIGLGTLLFFELKIYFCIGFTFQVMIIKR